MSLHMFLVALVFPVAFWTAWGVLQGVLPGRLARVGMLPAQQALRGFLFATLTIAHRRTILVVSTLLAATGLLLGLASYVVASMIFGFAGGCALGIGLFGFVQLRVFRAMCGPIVTAQVLGDRAPQRRAPLAAGQRRRIGAIAGWGALAQALVFTTIAWAVPALRSPVWVAFFAAAVTAQAALALWLRREA